MFMLGQEAIKVHTEPLVPGCGFFHDRYWVSQVRRLTVVCWGLQNLCFKTYLSTGAGRFQAAFTQHYSVCFTLDNCLAPRNVWGKTILSQCHLVFPTSNDLGVEEQAGSWRCPGTLRTLPQVLSFYNVRRNWISTVKSVLLSQRRHENIW